MAGLNLAALFKRYDEHPAVLREVTLDIADGEFCVFVGPSGCGKSTLLRLIAGLEDITAGELRIAGERVNERAPAQRKVAMVFQNYALYPHMTVAENIGFGLGLAGVGKVAAQQRVQQIAQLLQIEALLARKPAVLSGGQRQRVAIGRALVREPGVFLFDEPLSNLDAALRAQTRVEIARLHRDYGRAASVYVTHDQVEAMTLADKIVLLRSGPEVQTLGSVAQVGSPLTLYREPANLFAATFLGSPTMNLLPMTVAAIDAQGLTLCSADGHTLRAALDGRGVDVGQPLTLGVRSEDLRLQAEAGLGCMPCQVQWVERLGDMTYAYLGRPGHTTPLVVRLDGRSAAAVGDGVQLHLPATACHAFDAAGIALRRLAP
ncbi:ABC transporter ATP-binding protein [Aquabacterium sp.]|uniref:ABC transporter ATP-binding protein n=1 Tax=Aquabacterium sp. TaxID=1872578 RepID=UPI002CA9039C|nr:ATP-binding cassette domain-containing protein [Aquabacterium sp.]HSW04385.1 ATP-binding cassette domain-containing protein [Aquabacterium sp.]